MLSLPVSAIAVRSVSSDASDDARLSPRPAIVWGFMSLNCSANPVIVGSSPASAREENLDIHGWAALRTLHALGATDP